MHYPLKGSYKLYARIGAICVLASAPILAGCSLTQSGEPSANEEAAIIAGQLAAIGAAERAAEREEIAAAERRRRAERRRFRELIGESNCYAEPRTRHAATAAMERMLDGVGGEYYSEGGHGGDGGGC
ncbi:MAG: hypothetical protein JJ920_12800 [Roseitalea sp.]|jgi:hypothetical protein|nr:hypothetical protein [Roseitalea sp.]MBO6720637.1 hypothetical protein [Roseitalea sp.]MBO6743784.1 hypothetical protein [Roseitalea sp.]